jgi:hypothetical protein
MNSNERKNATIVVVVVVEVAEKLNHIKLFSSIKFSNL